MSARLSHVFLDPCELLIFLAYVQLIRKSWGNKYNVLFGDYIIKLLFSLIGRVDKSNFPQQ